MNNLPMYEKLLAYINFHQISQKQLALEAGMTAAKISQLLHGKRRLMVEDFIVLCRCLQLDPAELFRPDFLELLAS